MFKLKRVDEPADKKDGMRVLVDRLWPRGVSKRAAKLDRWEKNLAPSPALRRWFHQHPPGRWKEFSKRYREELTKNKDAVRAFRKEAKGVVTLLYAGADEKHNYASILKKILTSRR